MLYNYKYNGVELQETGMYAMDWRNYMSDIGRFAGMDALSESYADHSPYHFAMNNPVSFSDPSGMYSMDAGGNISTSNSGEISALFGYFSGGGKVKGISNFMQSSDVFARDLPGLNLSGHGTASTWGSALSTYNLNHNTIYNGIAGVQAAWNNANRPFDPMSWVKNDGGIKMMGGAGDPLGIWEGIGMALSASDNPNMNLAALPLLVMTRNGDDALKLLAAEKGIFNTEVNVVRGGTCLACQFENGSGVTIDTKGLLNGVSVNSVKGLSIKDLSAGIPNGKIGTTTVSHIEALGGKITSSPTKNNPFHSTLSGITAAQAEKLFNPTIKNPLK